MVKIGDDVAALGIDLDGAVRDCLFGREDRVQLLVFDLDQQTRVLGLLFGVRDDGDDRLAREAHFLLRQDRRVV